MSPLHVDLYAHTSAQDITDTMGITDITDVMYTIVDIMDVMDINGHHGHHRHQGRSVVNKLSNMYGAPRM